jgi:hypothetical protein
VVEVLDLAQHYKIAGLANAAAAVIAEQMSVANVCAVLAAASRFNRPDLVKRCTEFSERHLAALLKTPAFCELPDAAVMSLVQSDRSQASELELFLGVVRWGRSRFGNGKAPASPAAAVPVNASATAAAAAASVKENLAAYLAHIRFPLIDGKSLDSAVESTGLVDESLLFEAYRFHSSGRMLHSSPRFRRRGGVSDPVLPNGIQSPASNAAPTPVPSTPATPNQVKTSYNMQSRTPATPNFNSVKPTTPNFNSVKPTTGPRPPNSSAGTGPRPPNSPAPTATPPAAAASGRPTPGAPTTPAAGSVPASSPAPATPTVNPVLAQQIKTATAQWMKMCDFIPPDELIKGAYELLVHLSGGAKVNLTFQHVR